MKEEIIVAGFGGQGVVFIGEILAWAAMLEQKHVTMVSSYGAETRGGTVNAMIVISDREIDSPFVEQPDSLLVMNGPSLERFGRTLKPNGLLIINSSLIKDGLTRKDARIIEVKATNLAQDLGNDGLANMVMLGSWLRKKGDIVSWGNVVAALTIILRKKSRPHFLAANLRALKRGAELISPTPL